MVETDVEKIEDDLAPEDIEDEIDDIDLDDIDDLDELDRQSAEALNLRQYWIKRLDYLQHEIDTRLWKGRAVGGDDTIKNDLTLLELEDKCESAYIEIRCSLVNTREAHDVMADAWAQLDRTRSKFGGNKYPTAVCGLIQSVLYEQKMGFRTNPHSKWNFSESNTKMLYERALNGDEDAIKELVEMEAKNVDAGDYIYQAV